MQWYFFIRYGLIPVALFSWLGYQLVVKKKSFQDIKNDFYAALFLAGVYLFFFYLLFG